MSKFKLLVKIFIGSFLFFLSFICFPFFRIRYGKISTSRLGHLCFSLDNYLSNKKNKNEIAIFCIDKKISNTEIMNIWKKKRKIFFSKIAICVLFFIDFFKIKSKIIIEWNEHNPIPTNLNLSNINFQVNKEFFQRGNLLKSKLKMDSNKEIICLVNRDDLYVKKFTSDKNFHEFKDFKFDDYEMAIKNLISKNKTVVRIGNHVKDNFKFIDKNFYSLTNKNSNEFSDLYFLSQSKFCVHGLNGIHAVPTMFRKKTCFVNYIPFFLDQLSTASIGSIFIIKKLYSKNEERFLKFSEIEKLNYDIHYNGDFFRDKNIEVIDNTPEEISDTILEFDSEHDQEIYKINKNSLQEKFWNTFKYHRSYDLIVNKLNIRISNKFLEKNENLI